MTGRGDDTDDKSLGQLFSDLMSQVGDLVSTEMDLAKAELKEEIKKSGRAGGMLGGAAMLGNLAVLLIAFAAAWGLAELTDMPAGWAFLIVGALVAIAAAVLFSMAKKEMEQIDPVPERTVRTLKEDAEWMRNRTS